MKTRIEISLAVLVFLITIFATFSFTQKLENVEKQKENSERFGRGENPTSRFTFRQLYNVELNKYINIFCIEGVEYLGSVEHPSIKYTKEGKFSVCE